MAKTKNTSVNYPVGDFFIRIKNAIMSDNKVIEVPATKLIMKAAEAMKREGFVDEVSEENGTIKVRLAYRHKKPILLDLRLVSTPGLRIYTGLDKLESRRAASILILSTPKGILSSKEAVKEKVGGEVIAEVY